MKFAARPRSLLAALALVALHCGLCAFVPFVLSITYLCTDALLRLLQGSGSFLTYRSAEWSTFTLAGWLVSVASWCLVWLTVAVLACRCMGRLSLSGHAT